MKILKFIFWELILLILHQNFFWVSFTVKLFLMKIFPYLFTIKLNRCHYNPRFLNGLQWYSDYVGIFFNYRKKCFAPLKCALRCQCCNICAVAQSFVIVHCRGNNWLIRERLIISTLGTDGILNLYLTTAACDNTRPMNRSNNSGSDIYLQRRKARAKRKNISMILCVMRWLMIEG